MLHDGQNAVNFTHGKQGTSPDQIKTQNTIMNNSNTTLDSYTTNALMEIRVELEFTIEYSEKWFNELDADGKSLQEMKHLASELRSEATSLRKYAKPYNTKTTKLFRRAVRSDFSTPHPEIAHARIESAKQREKIARKVAKLVKEERARLEKING